jgi:NADH-quinone oxidoreductase subunit H
LQINDSTNKKKLFETYMQQNYNQPLEFTGLTGWIDSALKSALPDFWVIFIELVLVAVALLAAYAVIAMILIYVERKITLFSRRVSVRTA